MSFRKPYNYYFKAKTLGRIKNFYFIPGAALYKYLTLPILALYSSSFYLLYISSKVTNARELLRESFSVVRYIVTSKSGVYYTY